MKICFVVMPISDIPTYGAGHFDVVYSHIIKPACIEAGFNPLRADEVNRTNYIAIDIIKQIIESDMVICDISGRNPNVLYELGLRHAVGKPVSIIKDDKTENIFDIQGIKWVGYDESLRVDKIGQVVPRLVANLKNTYADDGYNNSLMSIIGSVMDTGTSDHGQSSTDRSSSKGDWVQGQVQHWDAVNSRGVIVAPNLGDHYTNVHLIAHAGELEEGDSVYFYPQPPMVEGQNPVASCVIGKGYLIDGVVVSVKEYFAFMNISDGSGNTASLHVTTEEVSGLTRGQAARVQIDSNSRGPTGKLIHQDV